MKKFWLKILLVIVLTGIVIQFIPVDRTNPPVDAAQTLTATPEVAAILERSCYDCHSNQTVWPWYSYVAPVSWLVASDVDEGREHLNFSEWEGYSERKKIGALDEIFEEVAEGEMPLSVYLITHGDAKVSTAELTILRDWTSSLMSELADASESSAVDEAISKPEDEE